MGHILMPSEGFLASLSEDAGTRSGFALGENDILEHLGVGHPFIESITARELVRLSSVDYADTVGDLLFVLGASDTRGMPSLGQRILRNLDDGERERFDSEEILKIEAVALELCRRRASNSGMKVEVIDELLHLLEGRRKICMEAVMTAVDTEVAMNPVFVREIPIETLIGVNDLFRSELLPIEEGRFFDQRYINYLAQNPDLIQKVHWRQFEGLTAEWFQRTGYEVELGPGRKDGGVDIRVWKEDVSRSGPPTIIVQCKRYKEKVDVVTVKALYSDLLFEEAGGGMIVTTSDITPSTKMTINVRNYPITTANVAAVRNWILAMKKPGTGFLKYDDSHV